MMMAPTTRNCFCGVCNAKLDKYEDRIKCVNCSENLHIKCVNLTVQEYQQLNESDALKLWKCPQCVNKATEDSAAVAEVESASGNTTGDQLDMLNVILKKIDTMARQPSTTCKCYKLIQGLIDENKKLVNLVKSQTKLLEEIRAEFRDQTSDPKKKTLTNEVDGSLLFDKDTKPSQDTAANVNRPEIGEENVENSQNQLEMSRPSTTYANKAGRNTSKGGGRQPQKQTSSPATIRYENKDGNSDGGFIPVIRRRRRESSNVVVGTGGITAAGFTGAERRLWLYIGRTGIDTTEETILNFLKATYNSEKFTCEKLVGRSDNPSFKVSAPLECKQHIEKPESWPSGVVVRRFTFRRGAPTTAEPRRDGAGR